MGAGVTERTRFVPSTGTPRVFLSHASEQNISQAFNQLVRIRGGQIRIPTQAELNRAWEDLFEVSNDPKAVQGTSHRLDRLRLLFEEKEHWFQAEPPEQSTESAYQSDQSRTGDRKSTEDSRPHFSADANSHHGSRALQDAGRVFSALELVLPKRIVAEEVGDALEVVGRLHQEGSSAWKMYLKLASTVFWISINAVREVSGGILGRKRA